MTERHINYHHGCNKTQFSADEMTRVTIEMTNQIQLQCHCSECGSTHILDISEESDRKLRQLLRRMFVRQSTITIPDELSDPRRLEADSIHDYTIQFHNDLQSFPDHLVSHRELQDDWETVILTGRLN